MQTVNGYAMCDVRIAFDDPIYSECPKREGTLIRFCAYYRGHLIWKQRNGWAFSKAEVCSTDERGIRYYGQAGEVSEGYRSRVKAIAAINQQ